MRSPLLSLAPVLLCPIAAAQMAMAPHTVESFDLDSGYLANSTGAEAVVFSGDVVGPNKDWMQIHFADTNLPEGSRLRLTSRADGAVQWFNASSLRDYANRSAFFNGNTVQVELLAAPGTRGNRVRVYQYMGGDADPVSSEPLDSICGPTDDRVPSQDPRQGRQFPSICTTWLLSPTTAATAGHCASTTQQVHFNVPLSTSGGSSVQPPPQDQYPYDGSSLRRLNGGIGHDWAIVSVVRNSNTGLYPGQAQGGWYPYGSPPDLNDHTIRITGYGSTSSGVPREWNYAQKTHVGDWVRAGDPFNFPALGYTPDTSGGNSGSPVWHEEAQIAIGIHTHAGCSFSGGFNQGTRIDRPDIQAAIAATLPLRTAGIYEQVGAGCSGAGGTSTMTSNTFPDLGNTHTLDVTGVEPNQPGTMFFGASETLWGAIPLPFNLAGFGLPNCNVYISLDVAVPLATGSFGTPSMSYQIPNDTAFTGVELFNQYVNLDSTVGATFSNGGKSTIGD